MACISVIALWGMTLALRYLLDQLDVGGWSAVIGVLTLAGLAYLGLQYMFLRLHLEEQ